MERKRTGSLYGLRNIYKQMVSDETPFFLAVAVRGKSVQIRLNSKLVVDYVEPIAPVIPAGGEKYRFLDRGTFALQCHNDGSRAAYKSVRVRPLPDSLPAYTGPAPTVDETYREIINIGRHNLPMVDFHVYLRRGLSLEQSLLKSRRDGIQYGITADASTFNDEAAAKRWLAQIAGEPVFSALSTVDGQWMNKLPQSAAQRFDYVIADANGTDFDQLLKRIEDEPIDILSGLGNVPNSRVQELLRAIGQHKIAVELNTVNHGPSEEFILQAKQAGCKFAFGTANATAAELRRCEYGLQMVERCKLGWQDFFTPGGWWPKAVERRWTSNRE